MMCAARLAKRLSRVDAQFIGRLRGLLQTFGLPVDVPQLDPEQVLDAMTQDKKSEPRAVPSCGCRVPWAARNS